MSYSSLAKEILKLVGGQENVLNLVHCATRLRFKLRDRNKASKSELEKVNGILSVVESGGQFQVVIGSDVSNVYKEIMKIGGFGTNSSSESENKGSITSRIFEVISGSFSPLLPALAGSGMLKALLTVLTMTHLLSDKSGTYFILSAAANAVFYFLPVFLGVTCAIKLEANPYVAAAIGGALLEPNFTALLAAGKTTTFIGLPVVLMSYSSSVFPIFISISIFAVLERLLKKVVQKDVQMFLVPMLSLMIMVPLTAMAFGPFGVYAGNAIGAGISFLSVKSGIITGAIMGAAWTFLTVLGLHWGLVPIILANLATGGDPIIAMAAAAPFAQMGLALGVFLKSKDKKLKTLAGSTLLPGLLSGVTEPIIYGLLLRYRRTIPYVAVAGAVGGAVSGFLGVKEKVFAFPCLTTIPAFSPMTSYVIAVAVSLIVSMILTITLGFEDKVSKNKINAESELLIRKKVVASPLNGKVKLLTEVNDSVFSSETMGKGVAIEPTVGEVFSPVNGTITTIFPTKHAIGIISEEGVEILIHIGIDTVQLEGKHFTQIAKQGDNVKQGDLIVKFDIEKIKEEGYEVITSVVVTNSNDYVDVIADDVSQIKKGEILLTVV